MFFCFFLISILCSRYIHSPIGLPIPTRNGFGLKREGEVLLDTSHSSMWGSNSFTSSSLGSQPKVLFPVTPSNTPSQGPVIMATAPDLKSFFLSNSTTSSSDNPTLSMMIKEELPDLETDLETMKASRIPLSLSLFHWIGWLNWSKLIEMGWIEGDIDVPHGRRRHLPSGQKRPDPRTDPGRAERQRRVTSQRFELRRLRPPRSDVDGVAHEILRRNIKRKLSRHHRRLGSILFLFQFIFLSWFDYFVFFLFFCSFGLTQSVDSDRSRRTSDFYPAFSVVRPKESHRITENPFCSNPHLVNPHSFTIIKWITIITIIVIVIIIVITIWLVVVW